MEVTSGSVFPAQRGRDKACLFTDGVAPSLLQDASPIASILSFDTGLHLNGPVQFSDKVKLITVSVPSSFHTVTAEEELDAFCFN